MACARALPFKEGVAVYLRPVRMRERVEMTVGTVNTQIAGDAIANADRRMAAWAAGIVLVTLTVWVIAGGSVDPASENPLKYVIYTAPLAVVCAYIVINRTQLNVDVRGTMAFAVYLVCALTAMTVNFWFDFRAIRDLAIVGGSLILFMLWFRAPAWIADAGLAALAVAMALELARKDFALDMNLFTAEDTLEFFGVSNSFKTGLIGSHGILESNLGFPLGLVVLYYLYARKWGRALVAGALLFVAFKRITFLGFALAVGYDLASSRIATLGMRKFMALAIVLALSIAAVFSNKLFETTADSLDLQQTSANSLSLGRYQIALRLWADLDNGSPRQWIIGSGPGSSDATVASNSDLTNAHNDWLKILFDYGLVGFVVIHAVLFLNLARNRFGLMAYLYDATLMMTDNVFIYMFYWAFLFMMMRAARQ